MSESMGAWRRCGVANACACSMCSRCAGRRHVNLTSYTSLPRTKSVSNQISSSTDQHLVVDNLPASRVIMGKSGIRTAAKVSLDIPAAEQKVLHVRCPPALPRFSPGDSPRKQNRWHPDGTPSLPQSRSWAARQRSEAVFSDSLTQRPG